MAERHWVKRLVPFMHLLTFVFVPVGASDVSKHLDAVLNGRDRVHCTFPNFTVRCSCIGSVASHAGFNAFDESERGQRVGALLADARRTGDSDTERLLLRERRIAARTIESAHPERGKVDPTCDICNGSGAFEQSRDPATHVDWWSVGGRWELLFRSNDDVTVPSPPTIEANTLPAPLVPRTIMPAAVVTPEGHWFELPVRYSFIEPSEATLEEAAIINEWRLQVRDFFDRHHDCNVILVDCHT